MWQSSVAALPLNGPAVLMPEDWRLCRAELSIGMPVCLVAEIAAINADPQTAESLVAYHLYLASGIAACRNSNSRRLQDGSLAGSLHSGGETLIQLVFITLATGLMPHIDKVFKGTR
jgi:hypothetical protein